MTRLALAASITAALVAASVIVGYASGVEALIVLRPGLQGMSLLTAVSVLMIAGAIGLQLNGKSLAAQGPAVLATAIGVICGMLQMLRGQDSLDLYLSAHLFGVGQQAFGQTSLATACCLVALGIASILHDRHRWADATAGLALVVSGVALLGYAYGVEDLYAIVAFKYMAVHTAFAIFALSIATLTISPAYGWAAVISSTQASGAATRRQLSFTLFPPLVGFMLIKGIHAGYLGPAAALAILVVFTVVPLALIIIRDGHVLETLDAERQGTVDLKASLAQTLEAKLLEQAAELRRDAAMERDRRAALRDSEDFARLALSAVGGVGVWTFDAATDRFFCDAAISELYGIDPQQGAVGILRSEFLLNVDPEDIRKLAATMAGGLVKGGEIELEYRIRHPNGSTRWVLSRGHTYLDNDGKPVRRTGVGIETTLQHQMEEQLRQSQKVEAIGQLTGGVAHDFNNLLTVIRSSVDLLKRPDLSDERRHRYIEAISDTTGRAAKLTAQLLAFARRQALKPEVFDVTESVRSIGSMVVTLTGSRIRIATDIPADALFVNADANQFDTAIINLVVNARDAMDSEGTLTISVGTANLIPALRANPMVVGQFVTVSVGDTGSGIKPDDAERIFEPFYTTKGIGHGTGLGLSQVIGFTKQSGGEVEVQSAPGRGATFMLYLPRVGGEGRKVEPERDQSPIDGHGTCVLVVEDNDDVGMFATQTLEELGYKSVLVADAQAALAMLAKSAAGFDVVFSDVVMPGMNGIEFGYQVRQIYPDLPVILTSGYSHVLAQNGTHGFELLHKPYSIEQLSRVLQKAAHWRRLWRVLDEPM